MSAPGRLPVALGVAAAASLIRPATAATQLGQATLLDPTAPSNTRGIPLSAADLYAADLSLA
ncbi:hypothetical protein FB451DRAFT_1415393 [Mycena latifolia]|nr:hypothetical protein FB451DRAFT_1415393 [Mycena latifolia]